MKCSQKAWICTPSRKLKKCFTNQMHHVCIVPWSVKHFLSLSSHQIHLGNRQNCHKSTTSSRHNGHIDYSTCVICICDWCSKTSASIDVQRARLSRQAEINQVSICKCMIHWFWITLLKIYNSNHLLPESPLTNLQSLHGKVKSQSQDGRLGSIALSIGFEVKVQQWQRSNRLILRSFLLCCFRLCLAIWSNHSVVWYGMNEALDIQDNICIEIFKPCHFGSMHGLKNALPLLQTEKSHLTCAVVFIRSTFLKLIHLYNPPVHLPSKSM